MHIFETRQDTRHRPSGQIELLGIDLLEEHARRLAALFTVARKPRNGGRAHLRRLDENRRSLRNTYRALAEDASRGEPASPATEWLLDNFHIVAAAGRDIVRDLPPSFFRRLPTIAADEFEGSPRIYALALELIRSSAGHLDAQRLSRFITAFQSVTPLTIGELWAWPSALKLALVEHLARCAPTCWRRARAQRQHADRVAELARPVVAGRGSRMAGSGASGIRHAPACSASASTAKPRRRCSAQLTRRVWASAARRSRTRFAPRGSIRRPSRRRWRT